MIADSHALTLRKTTLLALLSLAVLLIASLFGYSHLKAQAYSKIEPYTVNFTVQAPQENLIFMAYDYGYGISDQHTRSIHLSGEATSQSFEISLSAWKTLKNLNFIAPMSTDYTLNTISISKGQQEQTFTQSQLTQLHENDNRLYRLPLKDWEH